MRLKVFLFFLLLVGGFKLATADNEKYQIALVLSPTYERFTGPDRKAKLSYNFGIDYKHYIDPKITFQTGIVYQNKGFKAWGPVFFGSTDEVLKIYSLHYLSIPTNFNFHIQTSTRSRILLTFGLTNGYSLLQTVKAINVEEEQMEEFKNTFNAEYTADKAQKTDLFSKRYTGLNLGIGVLQFVKKKVVLEVHPIYTIQLNKPYNDKKFKITGDEHFRFNSLAVDFKIGYYINKQISSKKEQF